MPESVTDRCTKAHEYMFLLAKSERYYFDAEAIKSTSDRAGEIAGTGPKSLSRGQSRGANVIATGNAKEGGFCISPERANKRSVWHVATAPYSEAHFATFPPALIEPCILAGCPAKACAKCGAPWVRELTAGYQSDDRPQMKRARELFAQHDLTDAHLAAIRAVGITDAGKAQHTQDGFGKNTPEMKRLADDAKSALGGYYREFLISRPVTTGFSPSCACNAGTVPGTCLDPFSGAGTTGLVADRLQRNAILIDLNGKYASMAAERIRGDAPLFVKFKEAAE
jgi:hypothetical protein